MALAVYFHIKNRDRVMANGTIIPVDQDDRLVEVFDEKMHPLSVSRLFVKLQRADDLIVDSNSRLTIKIVGYATQCAFCNQKVFWKSRLVTVRM